MEKQHPLKRWRISANLTRAALAQKVGVTVEAIRQWEHEGAIPDSGHLRKIAKVTDGIVRPDHFHGLAS